MKKIYQSSIFFVIFCNIGSLFVYTISFLGFLPGLSILTFGLLPATLFYTGIRHYFRQKKERIAFLLMALGIGATDCLFVVFSETDYIYYALIFCNILLFYWFISATLYPKINNKKKTIIATLLTNIVIVPAAFILLLFFPLTTDYIVWAVFCVLYSIEELTVELLFFAIFAVLSPLSISAFYYGNKMMKKPCKIFLLRLLAPSNPPTET